MFHVKVFLLKIIFNKISDLNLTFNLVSNIPINLFPFKMNF
jgi:hypothetical protein